MNQTTLERQIYEGQLKRRRDELTNERYYARQRDEERAEGRRMGKLVGEIQLARELHGVPLRSDEELGQLTEDQPLARFNTLNQQLRPVQ